MIFAFPREASAFAALKGNFEQVLATIMSWYYGYDIASASIGRRSYESC